MKNKSIYGSITISKTGTEVPVFIDGKTAESKYNPEREAENIISTKLNLDKDTYFFIVVGVASGTLLEKLNEKFPQSTILAIEKSVDDLDFLNNLKKIKLLKENTNIIFTDINKLEEVLINNYIPALYKDLKIVEQRNWLEENKDIVDIINKKINKALGIISADFSVQAHFGKIWQSNIVNNLKTLSLEKNKLLPEIKHGKIAAIVAAGPSLDKTINKIIKNKNEYFIISTDTAFSVLAKYKISPDIVISIDGQHISHNHFNFSKNCKNTLYVLDLCSDHSTGKFLQENKLNTSYFTSGHPLSLIANSISDKKFPTLFSGAGTVTITALDLCLKLGFSSIEIFGADFSYSKGKAYCKGTYFDSVFGINNSKINTREKQYANIMFRTELNKINEKEYSTDILYAYKLSLEQYLTDNKCKFIKEDDIYKIDSTFYEHKRDKCFDLESFSYDFKKFLEFIKKSEVNELKYPFLPYVAWLKNKKIDKSLEFIALLKLAQSNIVRYN